MSSGFSSFVKKETLHILRDRRTMLITLLMPIVQILLFGFALSTEINNLNIAVVAPHPTETIRNGVARISANPYFTFKGYITAPNIDKTLRAGKADVVAVFADDYDRRMDAAARGEAPGCAVQLVFDASNPNIATAGAGYLQTLLQSDAVAATPLPVTRMLFNPQMASAYNFVPGLLGLVFIMICAMMTSISIVREKETGTMEVLLVSPVRPIKIVFAKMIPYFVLSCLNLTTILLLSHYVLSVPMSGSTIGAAGMSLLYLLLALALGLLISTLVKEQITAMIISGMLLIMPIVMLSGMVYPVENMPLFLQGVSCIIPARWYIDAMRKLMIEGAPFVAVLKDFFILLGMTALLLAVALRKFNDKLE